ncbi:hypothetical protein HDU67_000013 [Dinochytrium kinnereticum]|nr:hypothetical protein HDU67_000013 [Dinochytrium kinnereticum]
MSKLVEKKRKWDVGPEPSAQRSRFDEPPTSKEVQLGAQDLAELAACKINAMLGKTTGSSTLLGSTASKVDVSAAASALSRAIQGGSGEVTKDIEINDLKNRYLLTKGATQADIKKETGADVVTRGKYYADKGLATEKDPPLYLHITAISQDILDKAVAKINELIEQASVAPQGTSSGGYTGVPRGYSSTKLFIDFEPDKFFNIRAKIVGPQGSYMKHVQQETGCRVFLKGKGSGYESQTFSSNSDEALHLEITGPNDDALEKAKGLCEDLIRTVREEFERAKMPAMYPPYGYGYPAQGQGQYGTAAPGGEYAAAAADPYAQAQWDYSQWANYDWSAYSQYAQPDMYQQPATDNNSSTTPPS